MRRFVSVVYEKVCQATSADGLHYVLVGGTAMEAWR